MNQDADEADAGTGASRSGSIGARGSRSRAGSRAARSSHGRPRAGTVSSAVKQKVRDGRKKKLSFFTELMHHLDMLVYAELCTLYYMDNSFFRLAVRATAQSFFLSPRAEDFPIILDPSPPHLFAIVVPNLLCVLLHAFAALPTASEANRGYLHGGVFIDFVGQTAPRSAAGLLLIDLVVCALQCLMLAVHAEREALRRLVHPPRRTLSASSTASTSAAAAAVAALTAGAAAGAAAGARAGQPVGADPQPPPQQQQLQNHDAEERGVLLGTPPSAPRETAAGIELQPRPRPPDGDDSRLRTIDRTGPAEASPEQAADSVLDALYSGASIGDFCILQALQHARRQAGGAGSSTASASTEATAQSLQSLGYAVTMARLAAERRMRARAGPRPS